MSNSKGAPTENEKAPRPFRVLVTLRRGADYQKSGAEPAQARRGGQTIVSRRWDRLPFPPARPSGHM